MTVPRYLPKPLYDGKLARLVYCMMIIGSALPYFVYKTPALLTVAVVSAVVLFAAPKRAVSIIASVIIALCTWNAKNYHWYMSKHQGARRISLSTWYFLKSRKISIEDLVRWHKADDAWHKKAQLAHLWKFQQARVRA